MVASLVGRRTFIVPLWLQWLTWLTREAIELLHVVGSRSSFWSTGEEVKSRTQGGPGEGRVSEVQKCQVC